MRLLPDGRSLRIADPCLNQRPGKQVVMGKCGGSQQEGAPPNMGRTPVLPGFVTNFHQIAGRA
jgi:hypothetical protein